jgi:hypothetical protein
MEPRRRRQARPAATKPAAEKKVVKAVAKKVTKKAPVVKKLDIKKLIALPKQSWKTGKFLLIDKIGFELENEFLIDPRGVGADFHYFTNSGDGSLRNTSEEYTEDGDNLALRELQSVPVPVSELPNVLQELEKLCPNKKSDRIASINNKTCGTHVHISLKKKDRYEAMQTWRFYKTFLDAYAKRFNLPKYSLRLTNEYCMPYSNQLDFWFATEKQRRSRSKNDYRRKVLNFCQNLHGTMEIRVFPQLTTISGIKEVLDFVVEFVTNYELTKKEVRMIKLKRHNDFIQLDCQDPASKIFSKSVSAFTGHSELIHNDGKDYLLIPLKYMSIDVIDLLVKGTKYKIYEDS